MSRKDCGFDGSFGQQNSVISQVRTNAFQVQEAADGNFHYLKAERAEYLPQTPDAGRIRAFRSADVPAPPHAQAVSAVQGGRCCHPLQAAQRPQGVGDRRLLAAARGHAGSGDQRDAVCMNGAVLDESAVREPAVAGKDRDRKTQRLERSDVGEMLPSGNVNPDRLRRGPDHDRVGERIGNRAGDGVGVDGGVHPAEIMLTQIGSELAGPSRRWTTRIEARPR